MWIRSQDKRNLMEINKITVSKTHIYANDTEESPGTLIGTYIAYGRAIEVLDDIQKAVIENIHFGCTSNKVVYEMPKE